MTSLQFNQLPVDSTAQLMIRLNSVGATVEIDLLDQNEVVIGNASINLATGDMAGHIDNPTTVTLNVVRQVFLPGDIILSTDYTPAMYCVFRTSEDNFYAYTAPGDVTGIQTWMAQRIGHVDLESLDLPELPE